MSPSPRPGPIALSRVVDGARLRERLSAAALAARGDGAAQRRAALELLAAALFRGRMIAKERLEHGAGGRDTARLLAAVTDEVIGALWDFTTVHVARARNPTAGERIALLAVGGYGRGGLAPFSDIDLLFLRPYKETAHGESVIEYMLYALWDLGFRIGHASRTAADCLKQARADMTIRTALLEARMLAGDKPLADELARRFRAEVVRGAAPAFVAAKLAERDERHARAGASRFLVEPNVKEGKGALRDLHTLGWIARYLRLGAGEDAGGDPLAGAGVFDAAELRIAARAADFLEATRAHLHFVAGRAEERLGFAVQPEIARRMGFHDRGRDPDDMTPAVERFMRRYFLIAGDVGRLTRVFAARLEAEKLKEQPRGLSRFLPRGRRVGRRGAALAAPGFRLEAGRLALERPEMFTADPVEVLRLFELAGGRDIDPHPDALAAASRALRGIDARVRRDPAAARCFLAVLTGSRDPARVLALMNETGVLGRFLPEFGHVVGRTQFNMYHAYTVDEHSLRAVGEIARLVAGELTAEWPDIGRAAAEIDDREALLLAMLLHDTGKGGVGGQEAAGAKAARRACERLGLGLARVELVAWLVGHHLLMSDTAQKRDIADPATLASFVREVGTPARLRLLLALTVADIRAVGPGVWNGWKARLLTDLFVAADAVLHGGGAPASPRAAPRASDFAEAARAALAEAPRADGEAAIVLRGRPDIGATEAVIAAPDRHGLFADLAGAISALGADIAAARIFTDVDGRALDVFHLRDSAGAAFAIDQPAVSERLRASLLAAALGEGRAVPRAASPLARPSPFSVPTRVRVDEAASDAATVVEVSAADRPGLLAALADACAAAGLSIQSAHADSLGERVVDVFYLVDPGGGKIADPRRLADLEARLRAVMDDAEPPPSPRLGRARASAAR